MEEGKHIDLWWSGERKILICGGPGQKILTLVFQEQSILIYCNLGTVDIDFRWSGDRMFLVVREQKIFIFGGPGT